MTDGKRRYDVDWLRVIAIGFLLIYHIAIAFQPWGVFIGFIQSNESLGSLWYAMSMVNVWRIPLLFFVSGMGVCFAIRKRTWKGLLKERTRRILLPYIFGSLAIVPLHILLFQGYYSQDLAYSPQPSHLWFLGNIFVYVLVLFPLFFHLKKQEGTRINRGLRKILGHPLGLLLVPALFVVETVLIRAEPYTLYATTLHGWILGFLAFLCGFLCTLHGDSFWPVVTRWRMAALGAALSLYGVRLAVFDLAAPNFMQAIETAMWIFAAVGFAARHLNRPGKALGYLSQAAYPVYIIHMGVLYLGSVLIMPIPLPAWIRFLLLVSFTATGCFVLYEFLIRRVGFLRPLFGLKPATP